MLKLFLRYSFWCCLAIVFALFSCESDTDSKHDIALSSLANHEIKFYYDYQGTLYKSVFITPQDNQSLNAMVFSAKQMLSGHTYQYSLSGDNTAYLSMSLYYYAAADTYNQNGAEKTYRLTLKFVTPTQGYATGEMVQEMIVYGKLEKVKSKLNWYFCIDSSTLPDKALIDKAWKASDDGGNTGSGTNPTLLSCPDDNHPHAIDLGLPSGTKWACCNVGASSPENAGKYYAWGETEQKGVNAYTESSYNFYNRVYGYTYIKSIAMTSDDVAHVKMGSSWRMPSKEHQEELINNCSREWKYYNGTFGIVVTGKNGSRIFLPAVNDRYTASIVSSNAQSYGNYWSSSIYDDEDGYAYHLVFASGFWDCRAGRGWGRRYEGYSVRAVCP